MCPSHDGIDIIYIWRVVTIYVSRAYKGIGAVDMPENPEEVVVSERNLWVAITQVLLSYLLELEYRSRIARAKELALLPLLRGHLKSRSQKAREQGRITPRLGSKREREEN